MRGAGVGLNARGKLVRVKDPAFLVYQSNLQAAFRQHFYRRLKEQNWQVDRAVWDMDWGVHIQPAGSGRSALKYLGTYVARTAINDARLVKVTDETVTFRWKNRKENKTETSTLAGVEFVERYLRHAASRTALHPLLRLRSSGRQSQPPARAVPHWTGR